MLRATIALTASILVLGGGLAGCGNAAAPTRPAPQQTQPPGPPGPSGGLTPGPGTGGSSGAPDSNDSPTDSDGG